MTPERVETIMDVWVFVGLTVGALVLMGIFYYAVELVGRAAEKKYRTAAQEALERYWKQNKEDLLRDFPCPSCHIPFDAPDKTYFECPNCNYLLTREWVKSFHHRKLKEDWQNSFSGRFYRIAPEAKDREE